MSTTKRSVWKRFRKWMEHSWPVYAAVAGAVWAAGVLPLPLARRLGRWTGRLAYVFDRRHRAIGIENLALAFPEKSDTERRAILKASYAHLGTCAADFCHFRHIKPDDIRAHWVVPDEDTDAHMQKALAQGRGIIAVSAHIGFWELGGFSFPTLGLPLVSVSRPVHVPRLEALVNRVRTRLGNVVVHKEGALRPLLRALKENKSIGVIMDQYGGAHSPWIEFFGKGASTVDTCARLHIKTGAPLISNLMIRRPDGRYRWRCRPITVPPRGAAGDDEYVRLILREIHRDFEDAIREAPEQWLWTYKRWRGAPAAGAEHDAENDNTESSLQTEEQG